VTLLGGAAAAAVVLIQTIGITQKDEQCVPGSRTRLAR
jgi:hypothetical protein